MSRRLQILTRQSPRMAASDELSYLRSLCFLEARRVYGELAVGLPDGDEALATNADVLFLGDADVYLGRRSLAAMRRRLAAGASSVIPYRLSMTPLAGARPIYTLSGYEQVEQAFLATNPRPGATPHSLHPVSLHTPAAARALVGEHGIDAFLSAAAPSVNASDTNHEGLFHEIADYYGQARSDVLPFVPDDAHDILEIGCGRGATGALLQKERDCRVTGVELNRVVAEDARSKLHRVLIGDATELNLGGSYDVILACEVFEHLTHPERLLERFLASTRPSGRIILSVPNIGHHAVVTDLMAGRWDYVPIGALCYTHLRFFTRRTLEDWLERLAVPKFEILPQYTELPESFQEALPALPHDRESLRTSGFYVLIDV